jgi:glycosyltransferase involved in cell wall biosynthesis
MLSYTTLTGHRTMTVALDATPLTVATGGTRRYTLELARALARRFPDDQYWLLSDQPFSAPKFASNVHCGEPPRTAVTRKWWLWGLQQAMQRAGVDVFHGTDFSVPYLPLRPSVMTVHDLSPWLDRAWHRDGGRVRTRTPLLLRAGVATMVITPSEAVRRAVIERFRVAADRVVAVPLAASSHFAPANVARGNYFLFVGTLEPRKNITRLIEAWHEVRKRHPVELVLVGRQRADFPPIPEEPGLTIRGAVDDDELPSLYSGALAVVYPSLYEGFGLPVLEAMQCGALVVASRDPAILEVSGDAGIHVEAEDTRSLATALSEICDAPEKFAGGRERAVERAQSFSWRLTAERTREVYAEARRVFGK